MSNRILLGLALALGALPASAFAQAATEYALTHSSSATATSSVGTRLERKLNHRLNRLSQKLQGNAGQVPQNQSPLKSISPRVSGAASVPARAPAPAPTPVASSDPTGNSSAISVQGGEVRCTSTPANGKDQAAKTRTATESAHCRSDNSSAHDRNLYQSVITLPSAK